MATAKTYKIKSIKEKSTLSKVQRKPGINSKNPLILKSYGTNLNFPVIS